MGFIEYACNCCRKKVVPEKVIKICKMCLEAGANKRICCNVNYCDFCYTKNKLCPNCNAATRQEKQTGAVFMINVLSEHEECRACLDPGLKRRCCDNYYCDECYYGQPTCRFCNAEVGSKVGNRFDIAKVIPILIGWGISIFIIAIIIVGIFLILTTEVMTPVGIFGYNCNGFFPTCDKSVCIDTSMPVANGVLPLTPLNTWVNCDLNSLAKIQSSACIYDKQVYTETDGLLGYDVCQAQFEPGSYIFEDSFEYWRNSTLKSNIMKSAKWSKIVNGRATDFCGTAMGAKALSFAGGVGGRFAMTQEIDMSSGGWVESDLFISPLGIYVYTYVYGCIYTYIYIHIYTCL
jgi:hypothetical protein